MMQEETQRMDAKTGSPEASDEEVEEEDHLLAILLDPVMGALK